MSATESLTLIEAIVVVIVPLAGLIWYIINHRSEWKKIFLAGVVTVLIMAALFAGVNAAASQFPKPTPSLLTPSPRTTQTVTDLATVSPTPTAQVILINQTSSCTNCSGGTNFSLIVKNATIDPANSQVTLLIGCF